MKTSLDTNNNPIQMKIIPNLVMIESIILILKITIVLVVVIIAIRIIPEKHKNQFIENDMILLINIELMNIHFIVEEILQILNFNNNVMYQKLLIMIEIINDDQVKVIKSKKRMNILIFMEEKIEMRIIYHLVVK
jgi:hypothetical protein